LRIVRRQLCQPIANGFTQLNYLVSLALLLLASLLFASGASSRDSFVDPRAGLFSAYPSSGKDPMQPASSFSVLVFSKTTGFRHSSIPDGIAAITALGQANGFSVNATEDSSVFTTDQLAQYSVIVFLNTTGDILDSNQQTAFEQFIHNGGGFVGIHSATDTEYNWPWYGQLVGTYFTDHPPIQPATVRVQNTSHPSTQLLPERWTRTDEWYNFRGQPVASITILAEVDEASYSGGTMGAHHPITWCHEFEGGRAWYTAMGHTSESFAEPLYGRHLLGGILWAAGVMATWNLDYLPVLMN
jgi:type 1 glutamine amidotransferase